VQCHAAGGAGRKIQTKLAGSSRVVRAVLNDYERPIRSVPERSAPVNAQCSHCHNPGELSPTKPLVVRYSRFDQKNTAEDITLTLRLGASATGDTSNRGAHDHVLGSMHVVYVTTDSRHQDIPWVMVRHRDGSETTYLSDHTKLNAATLQLLPRHEMGCISCHNRAGHRIPTPDDSVDQALRDGEISSALPWIKQVGVSALHDNLASGSAGLRHAVFAVYQERAPGVLLDRPEDVQRATVTLGQTLSKLTFPAAKTQWDTYPDNLGHRHWPGCFRCHDGRHVAPDGKVLSNDCEHTCHSQPIRGPQTVRMSDGSADSDWHPWQNPSKMLDILEHRRLTCSTCHHAGGVPKRTCDDCHST
jgi:hypothetical protein